MLLSVDWVKEFVNLPEIQAKDLAQKFTMATAEVEEVILTGAHLNQIVVAQITQIEKHPGADKLNLVTFSYGNSKSHRVVCGAQNVKVGLKIPFAPVGTLLPGDFLLTPKEIRGVMSEGMLCSVEELGLAGDSSGLMELPDDTKVGITLAQYLDSTPDVVLNIDNKSLTHRPDLWGHYGMAREFATIFETPLSNPFDHKWRTQLEEKFNTASSPMKVRIDGTCSCVAYFGLSVDGIKVGESPKWMQARLQAAGLRAINNIVDISNYVMLELGMPLHIFDRSKIAGNSVIIHQLDSNREFETLDEVKRQLVAGDTVISDTAAPLVLAGIMGGKNSGVDEKTTSIFIEVANWKAAHVRKTSTRLGLRTDSSQRYEKSLDSHQCYKTLLRTLDLLLNLCPGSKVIGRPEYAGADLSHFVAPVISTSQSKISNVLGKMITEDQIIEIFSSLEFVVEKVGQHLQVSVPSFRATKDIEYEADLIEEIGRIIGYDNILPISPMLNIRPVRPTWPGTMARKIKDFMTQSERCFELMSYPMIGEDLYLKAKVEERGPEIINALSKDQKIMRSTLLPSLLQNAELNVKNHDEFRAFELGRTYALSSESKKFVNEKTVLGIVYFDKKKSSFCPLASGMERVLANLDAPYEFVRPDPKFPSPVIPKNWPGVHPFEVLDIKIMGKIHGSILSVHPFILRSFKIKGNLSIALLDLSVLEARAPKDKTKYQALAKYPGSSFDCTLVMHNLRSVDEIFSVTKALRIKEITAVKVADIFELEQDKKAVTVRFEFLDREKTLSGDFLKMLEQKIIQSFEKAGLPLKV